VQFRAAMEKGDHSAMAQLMDANFDRRAKTYPISEGNMRMVRAARSVGASAKFPGSGGAIIGIVEDEAMYKRLKAALRSENVEVLKPVISTPTVENA
jgi:glucuronokinase